MVQGPAGPAQSIVVDGVGSGIFTDAQGTGAGGSMNLSAQTVTIQNGGDPLGLNVRDRTQRHRRQYLDLIGTIHDAEQRRFHHRRAAPARRTPATSRSTLVLSSMSQNASVTTEASQASGGNIVVQATDSIRLVNSTISTSVQGGPETSGGNIAIDPTIMTLQNSQILAQAVQGQGGNITIVAGTFLMDATSLVSASSQFGLSGAVNIQSPVSMLSGTLATLPKQPLPVQHLLQQRCAAQANGQLSSLVVAGRDTLPSEPGGWLMSSTGAARRRCSCLPAPPSPQ